MRENLKDVKVEKKIGKKNDDKIEQISRDKSDEHTHSNVNKIKNEKQHVP